MMSIITKQPSEFHDEIPSQSSTTVKVVPVQQQQPLVMDHSNQKQTADSSLSNADCPRYQGIDSYENLCTSKDVSETDLSGKYASEKFLKCERKHGSFDGNLTSDKNLKNVKIFQINKSVESSCHRTPKVTHCIDRSLFHSDSDVQNSLKSTIEVAATVTKQHYPVPNISQDFSTVSTSNSQHSESDIKQEFISLENVSRTNTMEFNKQSGDGVKEKANFCDSKQDTKLFKVSKYSNGSVDSKGHLNPLSSVLETQDDGRGRKNNLSHKEELNKNESLGNEEFCTKHSEFTSLISSQRETILKLRREERLSVEKTIETKSNRENISTNNNSLRPGEIRKPNISTDSKPSSLSEKHRQKKKKKFVDYSGINDLFSDPFNVKQFYCDRKQKRETKLPSKFLYLSKMEKYLSHSPKTKHKKKSKLKTKETDKLNKKIKDEKKENIKDFVKTKPDDVKEANKIKIFKTKDDNTGALRNPTTIKQPEQSDSRFSGNKSPSKSSSSLLRDKNFHHHCRRRYYRLKQSNWNCSSRRALHLLKHKYNSIKLLFEREPIICLERINDKDHRMQSVIETFRDEKDIKKENIKRVSPFASKVKHENETMVDRNKVQKTLTQEHSFNPATDTENLVDPRVMSLSKTLQSTNSGKVGLEKIFKNYNSKSTKGKKRENISKSNNYSVKKKGKPDWSKWKEKLKEASNRMVDRKKSGLVIDKSINTFPSSFIKNSPPSILNFRIPLKSSSKVKTEDNPTVSKDQNKSDAVNKVESESSPKDNIERDGLELSKTISKEKEKDNESNVLKEIDEELTLEEFETDKAITYSINGYSIEISRDSPIDITMNDNKAPIKSECFDEEEVNKILYGDNLDCVSLDCHTRNVQEHFNDTDAGLTVTSDIIPNLCAQEELFQTENDNFSNNIDKSPPVLERSEYKIESSDDDSKNTYIVQINETEPELGNSEETIDEGFERGDSENEDLNDDDARQIRREILMTANQDEVKVKTENDVEYDEMANKSLTRTVSYDGLSEKNSVIQEDNKAIHYSDDEEEIFGSSSLIIENVCSLQENTQDGEKMHDKKDALDGKEAHFESEVSVGYNGTCKNSYSENVKLKINDTEKHENVGSINKTSPSLVQDGTKEEQNNVDLVSGLKEDTSNSICKVTSAKYPETKEESISASTKTSFQSTIKSNEKILYTNTYLGIKIQGDFERTKDDSSNRGNDKAPEKSAAAVMEDLENMWREMSSKAELDDSSIETSLKVDSGVLTEGIEHINEKGSSLANSIIFRKCINKDQTAADEAFKNVSDTLVDSRKYITDKITKDTEKEIDNDNTLKTKELETEAQTVIAKPDLNIKDINSGETSESETRKSTGESTPISSYDSYSDNSDSEDNDMSDFDSVKDAEEVVAVSVMDFGTKISEEISVTGDEPEDVTTIEDEPCNNEQIKQRKGKSLNDIEASVENLQSLSDDNMEQTDERIMCDFPNHNWLFNKYNISDVRTDKELPGKDVKLKKHRKDDKDITKHSRDVKYRRKSSHSTANILPTQRKQSNSNCDYFPESKTLKEERIKIKWNKVSKRSSSLCDNVNFDEKIDLINENRDDIIVDKNIHVGLSESLEQINDGDNNSITNNVSPLHTPGVTTAVGNTLTQKVKVNNTGMGINQSSNINKSLKRKDGSDKILHHAQHYKHTSVVLTNMKDNTLTEQETNIKDSENLELEIFGKLSDDDDDDDDDDEKLQIDETVCTEESLDAEHLSMLVDKAVVDDPIAGELDDSIKKVVITEEDRLHVTEKTTNISANKTSDDLTLVAVSSTSTTFTNIDIKPDINPTPDIQSSLPEVIPTEVVPLKNTGLLDKTECGSISFRQRTKPPVQLVHPQVHKPPTDKVKVETLTAHELTNLVSNHRAVTAHEIPTHVSNHRAVTAHEIPTHVSNHRAVTAHEIPTHVSNHRAVKAHEISTHASNHRAVTAHEIPTHVSNHRIENKEESVVVSLTTEADRDQIDAGGNAGQVSKASVTFASNIQLSSPSLPVTVLSTLAQHTSGCITVTTTSTSSFGNGMVVPIQPFVQNIHNTLQPDYVQNMPQLQSNIVQIQSPSIKPLCQQSSPVHIQNQLVPFTIYQAGNQTLISNYTYTKTGSEHISSNQPANIIPAQPVNFNINQTQMNPIQIPICRPVNSGPPPLLILPKPSKLSTFNQQTTQAFQTKTENATAKKQRMSPKYENNSMDENVKSEDKDSELERDRSSVSEEQLNNGKDSKQGSTGDLGKEELLSEKAETVVEEEIDDEIKKQMEELDKEIKRKEQEQEEMRRKKIELLEKMKQAKNISKLKETESNIKISDKFEDEKSVKHDSYENEKEVNECFEDENEGKKNTAPSENEEEMRKVHQTVSENEEVSKISSRDVVLSEIVEEADDDVFDTDTPIDLSSALKSNKIHDFSRENISLTVSDGIISIKETNDIENSIQLVCVNETEDDLDTTDEKSDREFNCLNDDGVVTDNYVENKCEDINYIEDIGLVNPFTGEYEINEDVEGVEYLDLSKGKAEDTLKSKEKLDKVNEESTVLGDNTENKYSDSNIESQTMSEENLENINEKCCQDITSEKLTKTTATPISSCNLIPITSVTGTINQQSKNLIKSIMTSKSSALLIDSAVVATVTCSLVEKVAQFAECTVSSTPTTFQSSISNSICVGSKDIISNNVDHSADETPLNLEKVKISSCPKNTTCLDKVFNNEAIDKNQSVSDTVVHTQYAQEPKISNALLENNSMPQPLVQGVKKKTFQDNVPQEKGAQKYIIPDAANTQKQLSSSNVPQRGRLSSFKKVMQRHDQQILAQVNDSGLENSRFVNRQNYGMNSDVRQSRGLTQRKGREKYMEVKPAHYRSPPRKVHKGEKPIPAHSQHPTSRETMKKMSKTTSIHPHVMYKTSPFVRRKRPNYLSPKEILKPFPRLWEKKPPKPAHSKRPFGIAGHLIVQSSRKYRKREVSGEWTPSPRFYSLPNTPTSADTTPPRATSADFHGSFSPLHSSSDTRVSVPSSTGAGVSSQKTVDHHGAQVGLPSPIRAHCRPKSLMSSNQFYETSVLRPPALLRNSKSEGEVPEPDAVEVIDLTSELPQNTKKSDVTPKPVKSPISKERAIQNELNHAVSKRQRLDNTEAPTTEKINHAGRQAAARLQQQLGQINARQRLMPPPPYTGRQRMPVLVQVPRQPMLEQVPRMHKPRKMDPQFDERRKLISPNVEMHQRFQTPPEMIQVAPQNCPQVWPHYVVPTQETRPYGANHTQEISAGNEHIIHNQDVNQLRTAQRPFYPARGPVQTGDGPNIGYTGNPRMQHPNNGSLSSIPQQGYPVRGQSMPYTTTHNQTQIHQLLQQPHASPQMMQRGNISPQIMQRGEVSPQMMMQRGDISPQAMQRGNISPQIMQRGEISPRIMQMGSISPQAMQRADINPHIIQRNDVSPQRMQQGEISPQVMQRGDISPQVMQSYKSVSPHMMQRGMGPHVTQSSSLHGMQTPNHPMMYAAGNGSQMMPGTIPQVMPGTSPQVINATSIPQQTHTSVNSFQRSPITTDNQVHGLTTMTQDERLQKMKQIRAQHIRSQQIQNQRTPQQGTRIPDVRTQPMAGLEQSTPVVNPSIYPQQIIGSHQMTGPQQVPGSHQMTGPQQVLGSQQIAGFQQVPGSQQVTGPQQVMMPQQMAAFNMGVQPRPIRPKSAHVPVSTYSHQMAVLEPQPGLHPHQGQQVVETVNKAPPPYMMPVSAPQQQHGVQNNINMAPKHNLVQQTSVYASNQNVQSKATPTVMNLSQHVQNKQGQGHTMPTNAVYLTPTQQAQDHNENRSQLPGNVAHVPGNQFVQGHIVGRMPNTFQQNKAGQYQNSNLRGQNVERLQQSSNVSKNGQIVMPQQQQNYSAPGVNQNITVIPHSQSSVTMTTTQVITQNAIPLNLATNQSSQPTAPNTQTSPQGSQGRKKCQSESKVDEELPHLQQIHGECFMCGKYSLYLCSNCKKIWYCSPECQLTHWQTHADECEGQTG